MSLSESAKLFWFGPIIQPTVLQDYDANGNVLYEGYAVPGTPTSIAGWVVTKHVYTAQANGTSVDTHDSTLGRVTWDLRTIYTFP